MLILLAEREWVSNNSVGLETLQCRRTMSSVVIILAVNIATVINQQNKHTTFTVSKKTTLLVITVSCILMERFATALLYLYVTMIGC